MEARGLQAELWTELSLKKPSQSRLNSIGCSLRRAMDDANATFAHILRLNPNGVQVLRRYANFLAEVRCPFLLYYYVRLRVCCLRPLRVRVAQPEDHPTCNQSESSKRHHSLVVQVARDTHSAEKLAQEADDIEEAAAAEFAHRSSEVSVSASASAGLPQGRKFLFKTYFSLYLLHLLQK
jgi:hypothetical protein